VDGARWLPDNVVGCVARAMLMDGSGGVLQESAAVCEPLADVYSPKFSLRLQLTGKQPANATLAVSLRGIETGVEAPRQVGYGCIALFNVLGRREQPKEEAEAPISLNVGAFQLPLLQGTAHAVARERGGASELTLSRGPRVPCASLLVRIRAAASADGPAPPYARKIRNPPGPASPEIRNTPPRPQLRKPNIRVQPLHAAATRAAPLPTATTKAAEARAGGDPQGGRRARTQCHCPRGGGRLAVVPHADGGRRPRATRHARLRSIQCDGGRTGGVSPVSPA
jgi:hypothetical protein